MRKIRSWLQDVSGFQPSEIGSESVPGATHPNSPQAGMSSRLWRSRPVLAAMRLRNEWDTRRPTHAAIRPRHEWGTRCLVVIAGAVIAVAAVSAYGQSVENAGTATAAALPATPPKVTQFFPLKDVKRGQMGVAYTVFEGVNPEPMAVEILGVLKNSLGPGRDLILARLRGAKPEYTGVVAGMSGSPVYIDGKLAGALSYRIGEFSKEPIAGITPIAQMLEVRDEGSAANRKTTTGPSTSQLAKCASCSAQDDKTVGVDQPMMRPIETPLVMSGFSQATVARFADRFKAMGLTPVAGLGGADADAVQPEPLEPGSSVSMVLVEGDLSMAGTCTVTYVDPKQLLACGHPITQYGPVDMPMTKATVVTTLASPLNAFKIINTTQTVGAFTEDRAAAILGEFGVKARMIPVSVQVDAPGGTKTYHFQVLDNRALTPSAMLVSVYQTLQATNASAKEMSYAVSGTLGIEKLPAVRFGGVMTESGISPAPINAALLVNERFGKVYGNAFEQPVVTGLTLKVKAEPGRRTAVVDSARLSAREARAGDTIDVEAMLNPYQGKARQIRMKVKLPDSLTPGPMRVVVSDGATADKLMARTGTPRAVPLADTVAELNRLHANDGVYVTLLEHSPQAVVDGEALPGVPLSMANVLEPLKAEQKMSLTSESAVSAGSAATGYAVSGAIVLDLDIRQ